ncbi:MAG: aminotransferase class I/II-fold pyridoxal phosphate-dependent enzyme, partial [Bacteroidota bacterium]|nr:aminotransferase class I/II-fold pyridoxal phosphate-dependent enzyme [Bacteroidota bacterium]
RMLVLNSPHNPTGSVLGAEELQQIAELAHHHNLVIFSDEIYSQIVYDGVRHISIIQFDGMKERTIVLDGFSKTFAMTGWRIGYGLMPEHIAEVVAKLQTNCTSCTATFTQIAGIEAFQDRTLPAVQHFVQEFRRRRDVLVEGLNRLPNIVCVLPQGAFYVFPNIEATGMGSREFAEALLLEAGVACLSGTAFGSNGEGFVRFSYANSVENIQLALQRIGEFLARRAERVPKARIGSP